MTSSWLKSRDWQAVQGVWLALLNLSEYPTESVPWDLLRLHVDRHLNCLQRLVLSKAMRVDEQRQIEDLVQARFDQALEQLNRQRQQQKPYWVAPDHYRGNFSRFQAMGDLEQAFNQLKAELKLNQVPRQIRFQALHDLNLELMERYLLRQLPEEKALLWRAALQHTILLSWSEEHDDALADLMADLPTADADELAHRVLKSSRFLQAQRSAVRILARSLPQAEIVETFQQILTYSETPDSLILEILQVLPEDLSWEPILLDLLEQDSPQPRSELRQVLLNKWQQLDAPRQSQRLLQIFQSARGWHAMTRCLAIHALARHGLLTAMDQVSAILQEAARADDTRLLQLAAETLVLFKDTRAVPYLLAALNGQYRQETRLEKLGHAFASEHQEQLPLLVKLLEKLGQEMHFDPSSGLWKAQQ